MMETTEDLLLGERVRILQPLEGYRAAVDPVLLAAAVKAPFNGRLLDLGCGVGAASYCLMARRADIFPVGLELVPEIADLARRNGKLNEFGFKLEVVTGDAANLPLEIEPGSFDWVICNPPHLAAGAATPSPKGSKAKADIEGELSLAGWVAAGLKALKRGGRMTLIHRADRLGDVLSAFEGKAGAVKLLPLWPRIGKAAKRIIVEATKGSRAPLTFLPGLTLHGEGVRYTKEAEAILRHAQPLDLSGSDMS